MSTLTPFCHGDMMGGAMFGVTRRKHHRPGIAPNANTTHVRSNRRKQCSPNETKPYSKPTLPRKRQTTPKNGHTPRRLKPDAHTVFGAVTVAASQVYLWP